MERNEKTKKGRNSQQEIGLKKLEEFDIQKVIKNNEQKKNRNSLLVENSSHSRKNRTVEKKRKKQSMDEMNIKTDIKVENSNNYAENSNMMQAITSANEK